MLVSWLKFVFVFSSWCFLSLFVFKDISLGCLTVLNELASHLGLEEMVMAFVCLMFYLFIFYTMTHTSAS